jgi:hypothetical protein
MISDTKVSIKHQLRHSPRDAAVKTLKVRDRSLL